MLTVETDKAKQSPTEFSREQEYHGRKPERGCQQEAQLSKATERDLQRSEHHRHFGQKTEFVKEVVHGYKRQQCDANSELHWVLEDSKSQRLESTECDQKQRHVLKFSRINGLSGKVWRVIILAAILVCCSIFFSSPAYKKLAQNCGLLENSLKPSSSYSAQYCSSIPPISYSEFVSRQARLAKTLYEHKASAYIAEPGANTYFFGNFSKLQWSLSERPLLLVITPVVDQGEVGPHVTILTPKFEAMRAKLLPIPSFDGVVNYVEWAEDEDPYAVALSVLPPTPPAFEIGLSRKLFVDNNIRKFIVDGLYDASGSKSQGSQTTEHNELRSIHILSAPPQITHMRERKSQSELQILKCINEATLLAIRDVHKRLVPGIHESYARSMMATALDAAGLKDGGCLTLFGENAALPHGSGTDRTLTESDFVLFDCTASLHGYYSDVTRTVALSASAPLSPMHLDLWYRVRNAQLVALRAARNGTRTRAVDEAARAALATNGGWDRYFTHRLGHGIGLEVHEPPYLRGGSDDIIQLGHTFSDEPGVYIEGEVGVRLEDCFFINEDGEGEFLTAGVGGPSTSPWLP